MSLAEPKALTYPYIYYIINHSSLQGSTQAIHYIYLRWTRRQQPINQSIARQTKTNAYLVESIYIECIETVESTCRHTPVHMPTPTHTYTPYPPPPPTHNP